ncbi:MAG: hypothetical protein ABIT64_00660 [Lysobacteraceae bacterium]
MNSIVSMHRFLLGAIVLSSALALIPAPSQACGEGAFNAGGGLAYQSYLAPRPATVLIYTAPDSTTSHADRDALYAGLKKAGHTLTVVSDADGLSSALHDHHFDVVITSLDTADVLNAATASAVDKPHLLPVAARSERDSPELHSRYKEFLVDGASLGQYLKTINSMVASNAR